MSVDTQRLHQFSRRARQRLAVIIDALSRLSIDLPSVLGVAAASRVSLMPKCLQTAEGEEIQKFKT